MWETGALGCTYVYTTLSLCKQLLLGDLIRKGVDPSSGRICSKYNGQVHVESQYSKHYSGTCLRWPPVGQ